MWILKLHFAISILLLITFYGFSKVYKDIIRKNGWLEEKRKKKPFAILVFFVPIMNILIIILLFMMILVKREDFEELTEYAKNESEE